MKKILPYLLGLGLLTAIGFKVASELPQKPTYLTLGRPAPTAVAASPAATIANGLCQGVITVEMFSPQMGITQDDVDAYAQRYTDAAKTCDEVAYLGVVANPDGSSDYIYRIVTAGRQNWYIFTVADSQVTNIQ